MARFVFEDELKTSNATDTPLSDNGSTTESDTGAMPRFVFEDEVVHQGPPIKDFSEAPSYGDLGELAKAGAKDVLAAANLLKADAATAKSVSLGNEPSENLDIADLAGPSQGKQFNPSRGFGISAISNLPVDKHGKQLVGFDTNALQPSAESRDAASQVKKSLQKTLSDARKKALRETAKLISETSKVHHSPDVEKALQSDDLSEVMKHVMRNPARYVLEVSARSAAPSIAALASGAAGAAAGPVGFAAGLGAGSGAVDFAMEIMNGLREHGVDTTDADAVARALDDRKLMNKLAKQSALHAAFVGTVDGLTGGAASKFIAPKALKGKLSGELVNIFNQAAIQMAGGAGGEYLGSKAAGKDVSAGELVAEAGGELVTTPIDVLTARGSARLRAAEDNANQGNRFVFESDLQDARSDVERLSSQFDKALAEQQQPDLPIPEPESAIKAQLDAFKEGRKPAVLITPGSPMPEIPQGAMVADIPEGKLIYRDVSALRDALNGKLGDVLGYGINQKPQSDTVVTARDKEGRVVQDVLTDGRPEVIEAAKAAAGAGGSVQVRTAEDALQERVATKMKENAAKPIEIKTDDEGFALTAKGRRRSWTSIPKTHRSRFKPVEIDGKKYAQLSDKTSVQSANESVIGSAGEMAGIVEQQQEKIPGTKSVADVQDTGIPKTEKPEKAKTTPRPNPAILEHAGEKDRAFTESGDEIPVRWAIVDVSQLIPSHEMRGNSLAKRKDYPTELQPRDRDRTASVLQIAKIANKLNPELLGESPKASDGAPIIGDDGVVESGNGRVAAIKHAYDLGKADKYRKWVVDKARLFGIDDSKVSSLKHPVLVRVRDLPMDTKQRVEFARRANEQSVAAMSPSEQAKVDADRLKDALDTMRINDASHLNAPANRDFVRSFISVIPENERGALVTGDGALSQTGIIRLRNALFQAAYGDANLTARLAEETEYGLNNILNGLVASAPRIAKLRKGMEDGVYHKEFDISQTVRDAITLILRARSKGVDIETLLGGPQQALLSEAKETASPEVREMALALEAFRRSGKRIHEMLQYYAEQVERLGSPRQNVIFDDVKLPTQEELISKARGRVDGSETNAETQHGLFDSQSSTERSRDRRGKGEVSQGDQGYSDSSEAGSKERQLETKTTHKAESLPEIEDKIAFPNAKPADDVGTLKESELIPLDEYNEELRRIYIKDGKKVASSRTVPQRSIDIPVGAWRIDSFKGPYGREVSQLRKVPVDKIIGSEYDEKGRLDAVKRGDEDRYAEWIKQGKSYPPIEIVETDKGSLRVTDGHRRLLAAKRAGLKDILAWVSPTMDSPSGGIDASTGKPIKVGLTYEESVKRIKQPESSFTIESFKSDIPSDLATRAYAGISFNPEKTGENERDVYAHNMLNAWQRLSKLADTPEKRAILEKEFARFREGMKKRFIAYLEASSRTMSPLITGPANFPVARNEKRMETAKRRGDEYGAYKHKAIRAIERKLTPERAPLKSGEKGTLEKLEAKLAEKERLQERMKAANKALRMKDVEKGNAELRKLGFNDEQIKELRTPKFGGIGFPSFEIRNNSAAINRLKKRIEAERNRPKTSSEVSVGDIRVVESIEDNRLRIIFSGKPDADTIKELKRNGFRWSPKNKAWQRQLTGNAKYAAKELLKKIAPEEAAATGSQQQEKAKSVEKPKTKEVKETTKPKPEPNPELAGAQGKKKPIPLYAGDVFVTKSGRHTTPFPKLSGKPRMATRDEIKIREWLKENAIAEAKANKDDYILVMFEQLNPRNWSQADGDFVHKYLFGDPSGEIGKYKVSVESASQPGPRTSPSRKERNQAEIEPVGVKQAGSKRETYKRMSDAVPDENIESTPFSKIWPKGFHEKIEDDFTAAFAKAARDLIPNKPRNHAKLSRWVGSVRTIRRMVDDLVSGASSVDRLKEILASGRPGSTYDTLRIKTEILMNLDRSQWDKVKDVNHYPGAYTYSETGDKIPVPFLRVNGRKFKFEKSWEEALDDIKAFIEGTESTNKKKARPRFEVRGTASKGYAVYRKGDREYRPLTERFSNPRQAFDYIRKHQEELEQAWERIKERDNVGKRDIRKKNNVPRASKDWRGGKDVSAQDFIDKFGFSGIDFGNWVSKGGRRQELLNDVYDALMDLSLVIGVSPKALSLNGELGLAFGARGSGWASAHFEPSETNIKITEKGQHNFIINLTRTRGAGMLAHEWFHALDNYFMRMKGTRINLGGGGLMITESPSVLMVNKKNPRMPAIPVHELESLHKKHPNAKLYNPEDWEPEVLKDSIRPEVSKAFAELVKEIYLSPMASRSRAADGFKKNGYWSRIREMAARSFESYIIKKMQDRGFHNDYLANVVPFEDWQKNPERYPYPKPEELPSIEKAFDRLFDTLETKETDKGAALYEPQGSTYTIRTTGGVYEIREATGRNTDTGIGGEKGSGRNLGRDVHAARKLPRKATLQRTGTIATATTRVNNAYDAAHVVASLRKSPQEHVYAVILDKGHNIISILHHSIGGKASAPIESATLAGAIASIDDARSVYLVHNHPSDSPKLSSEDKEVLHKLSDLLEASGIELEDMLAITPSGEFGSVFVDGGKIAPRARTKKAPIVSRRFVGTETGIYVSDNNELREAMHKYARGKTGIIFTNHVAKVVGFLPMTPDEMFSLKATREGRTKTAARELLAALHESNATSIFPIVDSIEDDEKPIQNLINFSKAAGVNIPDAMDFRGRSMLKDRNMSGMKLAAIEYFFSKGGSKVNGLTKTQASKILSDTFGPAIRRAMKLGRVVIHETDDSKGDGSYNYVIFDDDDIDVVAKYSKDGDVQGWTDPDGTIHIIASNNTKETLPATLLHESLHNFFYRDGKAKDRAIRQLQKARKLAGKKGVVSDWFKDADNWVAGAEAMVPGDTPSAQRDEEVLAYAVTNFEKAPRTIKNIVERLLGELRAFLIRKFGIDLKITPATLRALARQNLGVLAIHRTGIIKPNAKPEGASVRFSKSTGDEHLDSLLGKIGKGHKSFRERVKAGLANIGDRLIQYNLDQFHAMKLVEQELGIISEKGEIKNFDASSYVAMRMSTSTDAQLMVAMERGHLVWEKLDSGGKVASFAKDSKGLLQILQPVADRIHEWEAYMVARRAARLYLEGREHLLTPSEIKAGLELGKKYPVFEKVAKDWAAFNKAMLDFAEEAGLIDPETRKMWEHADYIPFNRIIEGRDLVAGPKTKKGVANQSSGIRRLKGGTSRLNDVLENMIMNTAYLIDASMKNHAAQMAIDNLVKAGLATQAPMKIKSALVTDSSIRQVLKDEGVDLSAVGADVIRGLKKMWALHHPTGPDVVRVMRDGKPVYYRIHDRMVYQALTSINTDEFANLTKLLSAPKRWLTTGVTITPAFQFANFTRDTLQAFVISRDRLQPIISAFKGAARTLENHDDYWELLASGGGFHNGYINSHDPSRTAKIIKAEMRKKGFKAGLIDSPKKALDRWLDLSNAIENANRLVVYDAAIRGGRGKLAAAYEGKDLMDFSMTGSGTLYKFLARTVPFFNARVQGLYRLARGIHENPRAFLLKGSMILLASIAYSLLNADDDRYKDLSEEDKDLYWHFWAGDGDDALHIRIPKPFEVGVLFGTIPERFIEAMLSNESDAAKRFLKRLGWNMTNVFQMNPTPQAIKPVAEIWADYDFFTGRPIVGVANQDKIAAYQYTPFTHKSMIALGKETGLSPAQVEHLIRGYFGPMGDFLMTASDLVVEGLWDFPATPEWRLDDYPVIGRFVKETPPRTSRYTKEFWDMFGDARDAYNTLLALRREGDTEGAISLLGDNLDKIADYKVGKAFYTRIKEINKRVRMIHLSRVMTPEEKRERLDQLTKVKLDLYKKAVESMKAN